MPDPLTVTRELPPLSMRAAFRPGSVDPEKRTAEVCWTTGARVLRGWFDRYWEELSLDAGAVRLDRLNNGAPVLDCHNGYTNDAVLGVVESARIEGGQGLATIRFAKAEDDPEADAIFRKIADGIIQNVSVGYRVFRLEKVEDGEDKIPVMRATDWEPYELSVVPMGADDGAGFRSVQQRTNACVFEERAMPDPIAAPAPVAAPAPAPAPSADEIRAAEQAAATAEFERQTGIRKAVRRAKLTEAFADELIAKRTLTLDQAREAILEKLATTEQVRTEQHLGASIVDDARDKWLRGASAALFARAGELGDAVAAAAKLPRFAEAFRDVALDPGEFRSMSLLRLAEDSLERQGRRTRGLGKMDLVAEAFTYRGVAGAQTTSDFGTLLENVMHKTLLAMYAITPDTWTRFCATRPASDFRAQNFYRNGHFGTLDSLNEHGEFVMKSIPDGEKHSFTIATKGNRIAITRQAIVNDDMGAFLDLAMRLGRAAKLSIEVDVYAYLAQNAGMGATQGDGNALFHTAHANINATSSALSVAGLEADRVQLASQKDPSGNEILDLRPAVLVVPIGLGGQARVINEAQYDTDSVTTNVQNKFMQPNKVRGLFRDIVDTARMTGTRRYLFADPGLAPVLVVGFLDGQQLPYLESKLGWNIDGTEWKIRLDYGVGSLDYRGAVTNAGV